jgi:hypothetical protein
MSASAHIPASSADPAEHWHALLRPVLAEDPHFSAEFFARLRDAKLTFGDRIHCPFLRPFFLSPEDERRVRVVAETVADLGERVVTAALEVPSLFAQLHRASTLFCFPIRSNSPNTMARLPRAPATPKRSPKFSASYPYSKNSLAHSKRTVTR